MRQLWAHAAVEQLQHLIVRRATNVRSVLRQEVVWQWNQIQKDINLAIEEMDTYTEMVKTLPSSCAKEAKRLS